MLCQTEYRILFASILEALLSPDIREYSELQFDPGQDLYSRCWKLKHEVPVTRELSFWIPVITQEAHPSGWEQWERQGSTTRKVPWEGGGKIISSNLVHDSGQDFRPNGIRVEMLLPWGPRAISRFGALDVRTLIPGTSFLVGESPSWK